MFEICKEFTFSAAHSIYSQRLLKGLADDTYPKCRRLPGHGHNYKVLIYLKSESLDSSQMVTDFGHLKWFKVFLKEFLDHKLIVGMEDKPFFFLLEKLDILKDGKIVIPKIGGGEPEAKMLTVNKYYEIEKEEFHPVPVSEIKDYHFLTFSDFNPRNTENFKLDFYQRFFDGIAFFSGSPTSENLSRFIFKLVNKKMEKLKIKCSKVSIYETESSFASYQD